MEAVSCKLQIERPTTPNVTHPIKVANANDHEDDNKGPHRRIYKCF